MQEEYFGNMGVPALNNIAKGVMSEAGIPYADLYTHITNYCGEIYYKCDICDNESAGWPPESPPGAICGAHYTPSGYDYIVEFLGPLIASILQA